MDLKLALHLQPLAIIADGMLLANIASPDDVFSAPFGREELAFQRRPAPSFTPV